MFAPPEYGREQGGTGGQHGSVGDNLLVILARQGHITEVTVLTKFKESSVNITLVVIPEKGKIVFRSCHFGKANKY